MKGKKDPRGTVSENGSKAESAERGPKVANAEKGPGVAVSEKGLMVEVSDKGPQEAIADKGPKGAVSNKGPKAGDAEEGRTEAKAEKGPKAVSAEKGPGVAVPRKGPEEAMTGEQRIQALGACPFARLLGMEIVETWPGGARVVMDATGKENFLGVAHGGAIFALADQAFAAAANRGELLQVAVSVHIHYLTPAKGRLEAVARLVGETDLYSHILVEVKSGERVVATFEGIAYKA